MIDLLRDLSRRRLPGTPRGKDLPAEAERWRRELAGLDSVRLREAVESWEGPAWPTPAELKASIQNSNAVTSPLASWLDMPGPAATAADAARWPAIVSAMVASSRAPFPDGTMGLDTGRIQAIRIWIEPLRPVVEDGVLWLTIPAPDEAARMWLAALASGVQTVVGTYRSPVGLGDIRAAAGVAVAVCTAGSREHRSLNDHVEEQRDQRLTARTGGAR